MDNSAASEILAAANQSKICLLCCRPVESSESWICNVFQRPLLSEISQAVALNIDYDPSYPTWVCPTCVTSVRYSTGFASIVYTNLLRHRSSFYGLSPAGAIDAAKTLRRIDPLPAANHFNICLLCCRRVEPSESWTSNVFKSPLLSHISQAVALNIDYNPCYPTWVCPTCVSSVRYSTGFASSVYTNLIRHRSRFYGLSPTAAIAAARTLRRIEHKSCEHRNITSCIPSTLRNRAVSTPSVQPELMESTESEHVTEDGSGGSSGQQTKTIEIESPDDIQSGRSSGQQEYDVSKYQSLRLVLTRLPYPLVKQPQRIQSTDSQEYDSHDSSRQEFRHPIITMPIEDNFGRLITTKALSESVRDTESGGCVYNRYVRKMDIPPENKFYKCSHCQKVFQRKRDKKRHEANHRRKRGTTADVRTSLYPCNECSVEPFRTNPQLLAHIEQKHPVRLTCRHCNIESETTFDLDWHEAECTVRVCKELNQKGNRVVRLRSQSNESNSASRRNSQERTAPILLRRSSRVQSTSCEELPAAVAALGSEWIENSALNMRELRRLIKRNAKNEQKIIYMCSEADICLYNNESRDVVMQHEVVEHNNCSNMRELRLLIKRNAKNEQKIIYMCSEADICLYNNESMDVVMQHEVLEHKKMMLYHCSVCNKWFSASEHLKRHQIEIHIHLNVCHLCKDLTANILQLQIHMKLHDEARRANRHFPCNIDLCSYEFMHQADIHEHYASYHKKLPEEPTKMGGIISRWSDPNQLKPPSKLDPNTTLFKVFEERISPDRMPQYPRLPCPMCTCVFRFTADLKEHHRTNHRHAEKLEENVEKKVAEKPEKEEIQSKTQVEPNELRPRPPSFTKQESDCMTGIPDPMMSDDSDCIPVEPPSKRCRTSESNQTILKPDVMSYISNSDTGSNYSIILCGDEKPSKCDATG